HQAGGEVHGVGCHIFTHRSPNPYIGNLKMTDDLYDRTRQLIEIAHGCVVLDGKSGTLAEFSQVWALHRARCVGRYPVVLLSSAWSRLFRVMVEDGLIEPGQQELTHCVDDADDVDEAVRRLREYLTETE
ncbi:MAG: LOG family protein, partial [Acidobacteriota bacterium]|nr:LOG family protein [Acidobacteriota bacterium]